MDLPDAQKKAQNVGQQFVDQTVPQNFLKSIPKFLPKSTFQNLKYTRWIT